MNDLRCYVSRFEKKFYWGNYRYYSYTVLLYQGAQREQRSTCLLVSVLIDGVLMQVDGKFVEYPARKLCLTHNLRVGQYR